MNKRIKKTNRKQFERMVSFMEENHDISCGQIATGTNKQSMQVKWEQISSELNRLAPPTRTLAEWKRVWVHFKASLKRKLAENEESGQANGISLNPTEKRVAKIIQMQISNSFSDCVLRENIPNKDNVETDPLATNCQQKSGIIYLKPSATTTSEPIELSLPSTPNHQHQNKFEKHCRSHILEQRAQTQKDILATLKSIEKASWKIVELKKRKLQIYEQNSKEQSELCQLKIKIARKKLAEDEEVNNYEISNCESIEINSADGEKENFVHVARIRKRIRDSSNPLELPDKTFISYFRVNKDAFKYLLEQTEDLFRSLTRGSAIPPILKLAASLRFLADGSYQKSIGDDFNIGFAQTTFSVALEEVLDVLESNIFPKWIKVGSTDEQIQASKLSFYKSSGFPGVIGCVDGTHVRITAPKKELQHLYLNENGYYSLNVMILCDYNMNICYVDAGNPGANKDAFIWSLSTLKAQLSKTIPTNTWILGDEGYPLETYLMTPYQSAAEASPESIYNTFHAKARNIAEKTIGILKSKFLCLRSAKGLHYTPLKSKKIIKVCCALHNISQHYKTEYSPETILYDSNDESMQEKVQDKSQASIAHATRDKIMRALS